MVATADQSASSQIIDDAQQEKKNEFVSYAAPWMAGGIIGYISGKISSSILQKALTITIAAAIMTENKVNPVIIGLAGLSTIIGILIAENKLRGKCVDWFNRNFEECDIHRNDLTKKSARIFSWVGFLL